MHYEQEHIGSLTSEEAYALFPEEINELQTLEEHYVEA